jgi:hypothetical protein
MLHPGFLVLPAAVFSRITWRGVGSRPSRQPSPAALAAVAGSAQHLNVGQSGFVRFCGSTWSTLRSEVGNLLSMPQLDCGPVATGPEWTDVTRVASSARGDAEKPHQFARDRWLAPRSAAEGLVIQLSGPRRGPAHARHHEGKLQVTGRERRIRGPRAIARGMAAATSRPLQPKAPANRARFMSRAGCARDA